MGKQWNVFQTQGLNPDLLHCRQILHYLSHHLSLPLISGHLQIPTYSSIAIRNARFAKKKKKSLIQVQNAFFLLNSFFQQLCVLKEAINGKAENLRGVSISNWGQTVFL